MIYEKRTLNLKGQAPDVQLTVYAMDNSLEVDAQRVRPTVLVCPGGGYAFRSFREAEPVALRLLAQGFQAVVLDYSVAPITFPAQLLQVLTAIHEIRTYAEEWHVNPDCIAVMGFSAGGHLTASAGVFWSKPHYAQLIGLTPEQVKPNALILGYPVISSDTTVSHGASIRNLLGDTYDALKDTVSLEHQVDEHTPPTFLWHTWNDASVPVENALRFASALRAHQVNAEVHIYMDGPHGLSLANDQVYGDQNADSIRPACQNWIDMAAIWLRSLA
ncbi:MAG: alpha/beta hydrolase [Christensenellales bacterium]|jgi:acetyl esterase/lipase